MNMSDEQSLILQGFMMLSMLPGFLVGIFSTSRTVYFGRMKYISSFIFIFFAHNFLVSLFLNMSLPKNNQSDLFLILFIPGILSVCAGFLRGYITILRLRDAFYGKKVYLFAIMSIIPFVNLIWIFYPSRDIDGSERQVASR